MRISDWSSDVCSSDVLKAKARKGLAISPAAPPRLHHAQRKTMLSRTQQISEKTIKKTSRRQEPICLTAIDVECNAFSRAAAGVRSEEHTSELQSLMRISYAVYSLKKKNRQTQ